MQRYLNAYDRDTVELLSFSMKVPSAYLDQVKEIAHVAPTAHEAVGSYSLDSAQVYEIAELLDRQAQVDSRAVFFLEPARVE